MNPCSARHPQETAAHPPNRQRNAATFSAVHCPKLLPVGAYVRPRWRGPVNAARATAVMPAGSPRPAQNTRIDAAHHRAFEANGVGRRIIQFIPLSLSSRSTARFSAAGRCEWVRTVTEDTSTMCSTPAAAPNPTVKTLLSTRRDGLDTAPDPHNARTGPRTTPAQRGPVPVEHGGIVDGPALTWPSSGTGLVPCRTTIAS